MLSHGEFRSCYQDIIRASLVYQAIKNLPVMKETWVQSLSREDPLQKGMAIHSSILAWRIPWTEEAGGLQSVTFKELDMTEWVTVSLFFSRRKTIPLPPKKKKEREKHERVTRKGRNRRKITSNLIFQEPFQGSKMVVSEVTSISHIYIMRRRL